ncbi:hypothetical protein [Shinella sp. BYT-45]|uniref:hypothetical protein n=1 Tax=Shinella sp. BYT-45 TaxID=3377377 RepID=UPI00397E9B30
MKRIALPLLFPLFLAACTVGGGVPLEPVPGSITYHGQPRTKLTKSPIGSTFEHRFKDGPSREVFETYRIEPDRSLAIIHRRVRINYY